MNIELKLNYSGSDDYSLFLLPLSVICLNIVIIASVSIINVPFSERAVQGIYRKVQVRK